MSSHESQAGDVPAASMSAAQWLRIQEVFCAAVDRKPGERAAFLEHECGDDAPLRREVELLLDSHERAGLLDDLAGRLEAPSRWRSRIDAVEWKDRRVAQYLVQATLGAGGMGWLYKARDERLGRTVALKFLPPHLSADADAKQRLLQEARAAAALDHPNICAIHEIGETEDGQLFIAMPLYEGQTLQARLEQGPLGIGELTTIALQVASGLAKAHEQGIVHRDVKPANVMLLPDGTVKILDFGVARIDSAPAGGTATAIGTLAYMSPEQTRGERVDHRTDIWALGVVMYEMAVGARPFRGENAQAVRGAILALDPEPVSAQRPDLPIEIDELISTALAKLPQQRHESMAHVANELGSLVERECYAGVSMARPAEAAPGTNSAGERRRAAVLVCIVSDYVTLVEQHAAAEVEALMSRIRNAAVEVVRRHGGLVNHAFDEEIVALFGVPAGHEDDELRAVRAAIELHAQVTALAHAMLAKPVSLRSGIHSGLLVTQRLNAGPRRYAVSGTVVQSAHRLAVLASRNTVLISPECQRLVTPFIDTEQQDPVVLLADEGPLTPYRIVGESGLQTRLEAALRTGLTTYAGRHAELAVLAERFALARSGRGQVTLIVGEAGVGKSRLLHELSSRVIGNDLRQLQARCHSYGGAAPYQPFVDILRQSLQLQRSPLCKSDVGEIVARVRAIDPALEQFIPLYLHLLAIASESHPLPRDLRGEHLQQAMPEALAAILTKMARTSATVLLLEDWHWSDEGSRTALYRLIEIVEQHAMLVVVTSRGEHVDPAEWSQLATCIRLEPLDFTASVAIMQDVLRVDRIAVELARPVFERTGGNPFFLEEICRTLLEQGTIAIRDGEGVAAGGVETLRLPDTVQAVIRTRLDGLDKDALEVLRVASVIGREFGNPLLAEVANGNIDVARALDRLTTAGLVQRTSVAPEVTYRFNHVLTHEVTYESLLGHQRRSWHNVIGCAIERLDPRRADEQAELLAHHFTRAEVWDYAVRHAMRAAERAHALSQFTDALAMLDRARECLTHLPDAADASRLADVMLQQERLCETLGQRGRQQQIVDELIGLLAPHGASAQLAQAYLRQGDLLTLLQRFDAADRALSTALRVSHEHGDTAQERHALRSMGLLRWHEGRHAEALAITERALAIDRERHDDFAVAGDLANLGMILKSMGEYQRAIDSLLEALSIREMAQDPSSLVYALHNIANVYRMLGEQERVLEHLERANEIARVHLLPIQRSFHLMAIAHIYLQQGRVAESLQTYRESVELSRRARHADGLVQSLRALGEVLLGLDRHDEALPHLKEAATLFALLEDKTGESEMCSRVALILERRSAHEEAIQVWERMRALSAQLGNARAELEALEGIARVTRTRVGSQDETIAKLDAALAFATTLGAADRELALRNSLGILHWERGHYALALRHYETALPLARELGDRTHEGLMLNSLGVTLSRLNRHEEARTALEESVMLNREAGARQLEAHALAALGDVNRVCGRLAAARECFELSLALRRSLGDQPGQDRMRLRLADVQALQEN